MKLLIVDDSSTMRKIVMRSLRQAGFTGHEIEEAANGREALEAIDRSPPDVVLSDWNMPEMNGLELLRELRGRGLDLPFCFVTSEATQEMRSQATEAGANAFVVKPFTPATLQTALDGILT